MRTKWSRDKNNLRPDSRSAAWTTSNSKNSLKNSKKDKF